MLSAWPGGSPFNVPGAAPAAGDGGQPEGQKSLRQKILTQSFLGLCVCVRILCGRYSRNCLMGSFATPSPSHMEIPAIIVCAYMEGALPAARGST